MRAVLFSAGDWPGIAPLNERQPAPLLPLLDRPFLQHVIEHLAGQKITRLDLVLSHLPEKIEHFVGDGKRWGCQVAFHLARDPERPYRQLKTMSLEEAATEPILLGHVDRLPVLDLPGVDAASVAAGPLAYCWRKLDAGSTSEALEWTGWAVLSAQQLATIPADADEAALKSHLLGTSCGQTSCREVGRPLSVRNFAEILQSHSAVLAGEFTGLFLTGREVEPGIWLSRNVMLHPTAIITPPVYIGENCQIGEAVKLGPNVVVCHGCVLDSHSTVANSVIFPGSYVGEALELNDVLVDKNRLINARVGGAVTIADNFILGSLSENHLGRLLVRLLSQSVGLLGLVFAAPVLLATALCLKLCRPGPVLHRKQVVRLPAPGEEINWKQFALWSFSPQSEGDARSPPQPGVRDLLLRCLPALVNVARGELSLVGVPPRAADEIDRLPADWKALYLRGKAGIVTEAAVCCAPEPTDDDLYAAESYYTATASLGHDLQLLLGYLGGVLFGRRALADEESETQPITPGRPDVPV